MPAASRSPAPVLIVGAGPTGLMLACELARRGVPCRVVDQNPEPSEFSKALVIQPRSLELLDNFGLAEAMVRRGQPFHGIRIHTDGRPVVHVEMDLMDTAYPFVLCLPQSDTERMLLGRLAELGVVPERPVKLAALTADGEGVTATLEGAASETVRVPWLAGCDGAHSTVRRAVGQPFEGQRYDECFALIDLTADWPVPHDELSIYLSADGLLAVFPLPRPGGFRLVVGEGNDVPKDRGEPTVAEFQRWVRERGGIEGARLSDATWAARFRISRRMVAQYRSGRVFLAGDAAHIHSPIGGQGMNIGMQDACNLGWKLALVMQGQARPDLLDSYHVERHPIAASVVSATDVATRAVTLRQPLLRHLRDLVGGALAQFEVIQQRLVRNAADLSFHYRGSPIVGEDRAPWWSRSGASPEPPGLGGRLDFGVGPAAGEHAPDVVLGGDDGEPVHLRPLLRGPEHLLLLFDGENPTPAGYQNLAGISRQVRERYANLVKPIVVVPAGRRPDAIAQDCAIVLDPRRALHRRYGAAGECLYLIRPDGYVGYRCQPADGERLAAYLARLFI